MFIVATIPDARPSSYGACGKDRGRGGHYKHVAPTELAQPGPCTGRLDSVSVDCWTSLARRQWREFTICHILREPLEIGTETNL